MIKIIIAGSRGRMGQALLAAAGGLAEVQVAGQVDLGDSLLPLIEQADVVIDFSHHDATPAIAALCHQHRKAIVIGTTGHSEIEQQSIRALRDRVPMVWSSNYSSGVNALFWLTRRAAEILGPDFDLEVIEMHHRLKKDAPSGTATTLAQILAEVRQLACPEALRHGRQGLVGERPAAEIGVHAVRGGDVVGDHTVLFAGAGERLELVHRASSRETFARGALRAALWVAGQPPGIYTMQDVLGLR